MVASSAASPTARGTTVASPAAGVVASLSPPAWDPAAPVRSTGVSVSQVTRLAAMMDGDASSAQTYFNYMSTAALADFKAQPYFNYISTAALMPTLQGFLPLFEATFRLVRQLDPLLGRAPLDLRQPSRQCPLQVQVRGQVSTYRRPLRQRPLNVALLPEAFLRPRPRLRLLRLLDRSAGRQGSFPVLATRPRNAQVLHFPLA